MASFRFGFSLIFCLTLINFLFIFSYIYLSSYKSSHLKSIFQSCNHNDELQISKNQLLLKLNILDIYRLDVSCEYVTRDLGIKISDKYVSNKKCSISSKHEDVNSKIEQSIIKQKNLTNYETILSLKFDFDPYDESLVLNESLFDNLKLGGFYQPLIDTNKPCALDDLDNMVFVIPFSRSRLENLKLFLLNIHSYLQNFKYKFSYRILIVEQIDMESKFNKGRLINTAVNYIVENLNNEKIDCIVIHDVDLIPSQNDDFLNELGDYRCRKMPWHLSNKVYNLKNKQERVYNQFLTGGILSLRLDHFINVNGFSNEYFGWGAEDDDFQIRMFTSNLCIMRPVLKNRLEKAPFYMLPHDPSNQNTERFSVLSTALIRQHKDGLSNINNLTKILQTKYLKLFTYLAVKALN